MKIKVFTAFSGYDSQCMALDRLKNDFLGFEYELVGWAEIDKYAIQAHNAVYPQWADRNYGDISKINWDEVPDFDLFTYSSPCQDFSNAGMQRGGGGRIWNKKLLAMGVQKGNTRKETQVSAFGECGCFGKQEIPSIVQQMAERA